MRTEFVGLPLGDGGRWPHGPARCQGLWFAPSGHDPSVAFLATHYNVDFSEHYLAAPLAARGFGFLGFNTRFRGAEAYFRFAPALEDIGLAVRWLRTHKRVETVVLLGNSGGGSLMAAYQAAAAPEDRGELYISVAAHPGRPQVLTNWLDPSVTDESDPVATDPSLDMYDPANGPPYPPEFLARYRKAQVARNHRITAWAGAELERVRAAGFADRVFALPRTWADPRFMDPSLDPSDRPCPACYAGDPATANRGVFGLGVANTLKTWLEMWSLSGSPPGGLEQVTVPSLVVQPTMDTGVFPSDAAAILDALGAEDKQRVDLAGDHYFLQPAGAREQVAEVVAEWVRASTGH